MVKHMYLLKGARLGLIVNLQQYQPLIGCHTKSPHSNLNRLALCAKSIILIIKQSPRYNVYCFAIIINPDPVFYIFALEQCKLII